jgi:GntR family transcriptional regulator of arabinose operon
MDTSHKYERIAAELERALRDRDGTVARRFPSERELTRRYEVDRSTIRRALDLLERKGFILRRPGRRTEVTARAAVAARAAARPRVAFIVNASPQGWVTLPTLTGAEAELTARGFDLTLFSTHADDPFQAERRERQRLEFCLKHHLAGVILWPAARQGNEALLRQLLQSGTPVVLVDHQLPEPPLDFVGVDNVAAAYRVTQHFIQTGHRRIAHVTRANTMPTTLQRIEGYCRALEDYGLPSADGWLCRCRPGRDEERALDALLDSDAPPTALFAVNDMTALRLMRHLVRRQIGVPEQMAVAGIDDLPVSELSPVPLTTVHQPFGEIGAAAARLLVDRIEGPPKAGVESLLLPTRLVVRQSCGIQPTRPEAADAHRPRLS